MSETKKMVATEMGFYRGSMVHPGQEFDAPVTFKAKWAVPAGSHEPAVEPETEPEPDTLSELGRRRRRAPKADQPE